jgi:hypothetical protein
MLRTYDQPSLRDFGNAEFHPALKRRASVVASLCDDFPAGMMRRSPEFRVRFCDLQNRKISQAAGNHVC